MASICDTPDLPQVSPRCDPRQLGFPNCSSAAQAKLTATQGPIVATERVQVRPGMIEISAGSTLTPTVA
jgi:hypothetical protein